MVIDKLHPLGEIEYFPIYIYIFSAISCLGFSTIFHTFYPIS